MEALYHQRLIDGKTTAEAVHTTTLEALEMRRSRDDDTHPASWASFVAVGEWE